MERRRTVGDTGAGRGFTVAASGCIAPTISDDTLSTTAATRLRRHDRRDSDRIKPMRVNGGLLL